MTNLDVIFGKQDESDNAIDPVCKMVVSKANPVGGTAEHDGTTYYFCAPGCRVSFAADPARYLLGDHGHEHHHGEGHGHDHQH